MRTEQLPFYVFDYAMSHCRHMTDQYATKCLPAIRFPDGMFSRQDVRVSGCFIAQLGAIVASDKMFRFEDSNKDNLEILRALRTAGQATIYD
jgi:hypothetical protein